RLAVEAAREQVVQHRHVPEQAPSFGNLRHAPPRPLVGRPAGDVFAGEDDASRAGSYQARDGAQQRALARTVGAPDGDDPSSGHPNGYVFQRSKRPVVDGQAVHLQQGLCVRQRMARPVPIRHDASASASSTPKYASMTAGSRLTSSGAPSAIFRPKFSTTIRWERAAINGTICSI